MLTITVPANEVYDEQTGQFLLVKEQVLTLEHSLVSLSKWESKWHKPYITDEVKTTEENVDYVRCMTLTQNVDPNVYYCLSAQNINEIHAYVNNPMTATVVPNNKKGKRNTEIVTSELIYCWMIELNIPIEFQKWHLNRLITLIRLCSSKKEPPEKMSKREIMSRNAAINAANRKKYNSKG